MTFPHTLKSIKKLMTAVALSLISEIVRIILCNLSIGTSATQRTLQELPSSTAVPIVLLMAVYLLAKLYTYILYTVHTYKASVEDANFRVAFYSNIISLFLAMIIVIFAANREIENIAELLLILTTLLGEVYVLEGLRSLCKQLGHPEMDTIGGRIYALITTIFVFRTCVSISILVLGDTEVSSAWLTILDSALSIIESVMFLYYFSAAIKILSKE